MDIFISYRRDDSGIAARLLHRELVARWGAASVFMDIDDIGYGDDFAAAIDQRLARADVVLVVLGPRWHSIIEQRQRGDDWVRHEVAQALVLAAAAGAPGAPGAPDAPDAPGVSPGRPRVLPIQLDGCDWPGAPLPPDIAPLQRLAALKLRQAQLKPDFNELLQALQRETFEDRLGRVATDLRTSWRARSAALGLGLLLFFAAWLALFDLLTLDTRVAAATVAWAGAPLADGPSQVVLVAIDEGTVATRGRPFGPSWRSEHAQLVARAAQAGARVLAFDVFMPAAGDAAADAAMQHALQAVQGRMPVVLAVDAYAAGRPAIAPALAPLVVAGLGCTGQRLGRAALMPLVLQPPAAAGGALPPLLPSLALAAFSGGAPLGQPDAVNLQLQVARPAPALPALVDFYTSETVRVPQANCPALQPGAVLASQWLDPQPFLAGNHGVPRLAYQDVLAGQPAALAALAGRTVLVGLQLRGNDQFALAAAGGTLVWGSALIAAQIDALQRGQAIRPLGALAQWLWMTALAVAGATLALALRPRPAWQRRAAWAAAALLVVAAALLWYRLDGQVVAAHHLLLALALGGLAAAWLARRAQTTGTLPRWALQPATGERR